MVISVIPFSFRNLLIPDYFIKTIFCALFTRCCHAEHAEMKRACKKLSIPRKLDSEEPLQLSLVVNNRALKLPLLPLCINVAVSLGTCYSMEEKLA